MKELTNNNPGLQFKRFALLGMSGLGKTFISRNLTKTDNWSHYSVDYEIGQLLFKDNHENLLKGFDIDNLTHLSDFLGKPGSSKMGKLRPKEVAKLIRVSRLSSDAMPHTRTPWSS